MGLPAAVWFTRLFGLRAASYVGHGRVGVTVMLIEMVVVMVLAERVYVVVGAVAKV